MDLLASQPSRLQRLVWVYLIGVGQHHGAREVVVTVKLVYSGNVVDVPRTSVGGCRQLSRYCPHWGVALVVAERAPVLLDAEQLSGWSDLVVWSGCTCRGLYAELFPALEASEASDVGIAVPQQTPILGDQSRHTLVPLGSGLPR